jgi:flagellar biosynthetic protein FliQ
VNSIFINMAAKGLYLILLLSLAPLLASLVTGLVVSLLQALTQVQEQTLTFVPKMILTILVLILTGGFILSYLVAFMAEIFLLIQRVGTSY